MQCETINGKLVYLSNNEHTHLIDMEGLPNLAEFGMVEFLLKPKIIEIKIITT